MWKSLLLITTTSLPPCSKTVLCVCGDSVGDNPFSLHCRPGLTHLMMCLHVLPHLHRCGAPWSLVSGLLGGWGRREGRLCVLTFSACPCTDPGMCGSLVTDMWNAFDNQVHTYVHPLFLQSSLASSLSAPSSLNLTCLPDLTCTLCSPVNTCLLSAATSLRLHPMWPSLWKTRRYMCTRLC